ncbi:Eco57I restriction-modification methylase domain-containing protein [Exiguobacterium artemiae]
MLDLAKYTEKLYGKKIIDNSCGDGNILVEIVKRYLQDAFSQNLSLDEIKFGLENDIYGVEIDERHQKKCIENLNVIIKSHGIQKVKWKILKGDFLRMNFDIQFDYIIGNPPYVAYNNLDTETRKFIREKYEGCKKGKIDYSYAFIEESLKNLNKQGKLVYLIPNNTFKTVSGEKIREIICPYISEIHNYTTEKIFKNIMTASSLIVLNKARTDESFIYHDIVSNRKSIIYKKELEGKWIFEKSKKESNYEQIDFGEYFHAATSVATLLNSAFLIKDYSMDDKFVYTQGFKIEKSIVKNAYSPSNLNYGKNQLIIFPYYYDENNKLNRYSPKVFKDKFPNCLEYFSQFKNSLLNRKSDVSAQWYEFGRSQALAHLNQNKLLTSTVITKKIKIYELGNNDIPFSGIYITPKKDVSLKFAELLLNTKQFHEYINKVGINLNGVSIRITSKDINNFTFRNDNLSFFKIDDFQEYLEEKNELAFL